MTKFKVNHLFDMGNSEYTQAKGIIGIWCKCGKYFEAEFDKMSLGEAECPKCGVTYSWSMDFWRSRIID